MDYRIGKFYPIGGMIHFSAICFMSMENKMPLPKNVKTQLENEEDFLSDLDNFSESFQEEKDLDKLLAQHGMLGQTYEEEYYN